MWLAGLGGGLVSVPFVWWFNVPRQHRQPVAPSERAPVSGYVDHEGWMLTPEDVAALAARQPAK